MTRIPIIPINQPVEWKIVGFVFFFGWLRYLASLHYNYRYRGLLQGAVWGLGLEEFGSVDPVGIAGKIHESMGVVNGPKNVPHIHNTYKNILFFLNI